MRFQLYYIPHFYCFHIHIILYFPIFFTVLSTNSISKQNVFMFVLYYIILYLFIYYYIILYSPIFFTVISTNF